MLPILILFFSALVSACSSNSDCFIADSVRIVSKAKKDGSGYFLVARTSGFSDKVTFFELYDTKPEFDSCGKTGSKMLDMKVIDDQSGFIKKVKVKNGKLEIEYTNDEEKSVPPEKIVLEIQ